jgi:tryptophan synthase alpha subunit
VADGVIVGSALVDVIERSGDEPEKSLATFLQKVRVAMAPLDMTRPQNPLG